MKNATSETTVPTPRHRRPLFLVAGAVFLCLGYGYVWILAATTSSWDLGECVAIAKAVEAESIIPASTSRPGSPALSCDLGVRYPFLLRFDDIKIYGVTDQGHQDAIIETLKSYRHHTRTKPLLVQFYEKENWQVWSNPSTGVQGGKRGPEVPLRVISVR